MQAGGWIKAHWNEAEEENLLLTDDDLQEHSDWYSKYNFHIGLGNYFLNSVYQR